MYATISRRSFFTLNGWNGRNMLNVDAPSPLAWEHRVVGHEPVGLLLGGEAARAGIDFRGGALGRVGGDRDAHRALVGLLGRGPVRPTRRPRDRRTARLRAGTSSTQRSATGTALPGSAGALPGPAGTGLVGEEVGERRLPHLQHRIVVVDDVQRHRAVVGIDDGLDAVAHIVERLVETAAGCELRQVGVLPVRIPAGGGVAVDHPHHTVVRRPPGRGRRRRKGTVRASAPAPGRCGDQHL
jgi:hypothetical protein